MDATVAHTAAVRVAEHAGVLQAEIGAATPAANDVGMASVARNEPGIKRMVLNDTTTYLADAFRFRDSVRRARSKSSHLATKSGPFMSWLANLISSPKYTITVPLMTR